MTITDRDKKNSDLSLKGSKITEGSWFLSGGQLHHVKMRGGGEKYPIITFSVEKGMAVGRQDVATFHNVEYVDVEIVYRRIT